VDPGNSVLVSIRTFDLDKGPPNEEIANRVVQYDSIERAALSNDHLGENDRKRMGRTRVSELRRLKGLRSLWPRRHHIHCELVTRRGCVGEGGEGKEEDRGFQKHDGRGGGDSKSDWS